VAKDASPESYVRIRNLTFKRSSRFIFDHVDLDIVEGKITVIMGPSGTGKTTLLRIIGGELAPESGGEILVNHQNIHKFSRKELFIARREMSLMFQSNALFTGMSVYENVAFPLRTHTDFTEKMIHDIVLMKLEAVGLRGARDLMPSELSGGMARRVALARAIALDPRLMMYDEPFTGQDPISQGILLKLVRELNSSLGMTSIIVSHDVATVREIADYIYLLADGRVLGHGTVDEMMSSQSPYVEQFMKGLPDGPVPFQYACMDYEKDLLGEGVTHAR
jgi:phospholipid/cholesterol/gamma-HCH transport system ATP-binding protein